MKRLSTELKNQILIDIKEKYLTGLVTQKELALKHGTSVGTIGGYALNIIKEMSAQAKIEKEYCNKRDNSEDEVLKYGIPKKDKLKFSI